MRVIYRKICHARYLYIKRNVEKVWGARYTLGARYLLKNTVFDLSSSLASNDTIDSVLRHQEVGRPKDLSAPRYMQPETFFGA